MQEVDLKKVNFSAELNSTHTLKVVTFIEFLNCKLLCICKI